MFHQYDRYSFADACATGNINVVHSKLKPNLDKNELCLGLCNAIEYGHLNVIKYYVDNGINIHFNGMPLNHAILGANIDIVEYMIHNGAKIRESYSYDHCHFSSAIRCGNLDIINCILDNYDNYELANFLLCFHAIQQCNIPVLNYLICLRDKNISTSEIIQMIKSAMIKDNLPLMKYAISLISDYNEFKNNDKFNDMLKIAILQCKSSIVLSLINKDEDIKAKALNYAIKRNKSDIIWTLRK